MSIASGFTKMKNYILTSSGYKLLSRWTSSQTVHMGDGTDDTDTVEYRFGAMKGVTSSLATDNDEFALSASAGKNLQDQCTQLNQSLTKLNEGSKLKLLDNANGNTPIDITRYISNYSELLISVTLGNTPYRITINIPQAELVDSDITYQSGSRASASIGTVVNVQCSRKRVLLTAVIVNDNDVLTYSTIRIYGRK